MKIFKQNHLDIHFCDIINKNVISDLLTSHFISDKYFFFENIFWYAASKISIFFNLLEFVLYQLEENKKCQVSLVVKYISNLM